MDPIKIRFRDIDGPLEVPWNRVVLKEDDAKETANTGALRRLLRRLWDLLTFRRRRPPATTSGIARLLADDESRAVKIPVTFDRSTPGATLIAGETTVWRLEISCRLSLRAGKLSGKIQLRTPDTRSAEDTEAYVEEDGG